MTWNKDKMETLVYEKPILKKYGDMKSITFASSGSSIQSNSKDPDQSFASDLANGDDEGVFPGLSTPTDFTYLNNNPND